MSCPCACINISGTAKCRHAMYQKVTLPSHGGYNLKQYEKLCCYGMIKHCDLLELNQKGPKRNYLPNGARLHWAWTNGHMTIMHGSDIFNLTLCDMAVLDLNAGQSGLPTVQQEKIAVRINDFSKMNKDGRAEVWASAMPGFIHTS